MLFGALVVASTANFGYHLLAGRLLPVEDYGLLNAVVALIAAITLPAVAIEVCITRRIAAINPANRPSVGRWVISAGVSGCVAAVGIVLAAPLLQSALAITDPVTVALLAAYMPIMLIGLVARGVCLGRLRYRRAAVVVAVGASVRLLSVVVGAFWLGVVGAVTATVTAEATLTAGFWIAARRDVTWRGTPPHIQWRAALLSLVALAGFWSLVSIDSVLARTLLPADHAGGYAAASVTAKAALFAPQAVVSVVYPRFVARPLEALHLLGRAVLAAGGLGALASLVLLAWPTQALQLMFGERFAGGTQVLGPLAVAAAGLGVTSVLLHYHLASASRRALAPWVGVATVVVATILGDASSWRIAMSLALGMAATAVTMTAGLRRARQLPTSTRRLLLTEDPALDLTVVIPFYNPGRAVRDTVESVIVQLRASDVSFEVIAVSDGCTDDSLLWLDQVRDPSLSVIALPCNEGKGAALRVGLQRGRGRYLGFIDADGDIDPQLWQPFIALMRLYEPDVVLGSKRHPLSEVDYPPVRRCLSWGYQQVIRVLFRLNIRDTQTGIKLVRREVLAAVLPRLVERRFSFDLELLAVARRLGFTRLFEAPIRLRHRRFTSTIGWTAVRRMAVDTLLVFVRLRIRCCYDHPDLQAPMRPPTMGAPTAAEVAA